MTENHGYRNSKHRPQRIHHRAWQHRLTLARLGARDRKSKSVRRKRASRRPPTSPSSCRSKSTNSSRAASSTRHSSRSSAITPRPNAAPNYGGSLPTLLTLLTILLTLPLLGLEFLTPALARAVSGGFDETTLNLAASLFANDSACCAVLKSVRCDLPVCCIHSNDSPRPPSLPPPSTPLW